jgi:hypothetical protein
MRRLLLLLLLLPLLLLARLYSPDSQPHLHWLEGGWHDPDHESTRLVWTQTEEHGALGVLTCEQQTIVLAIAPNGHLTTRALGPKLESNGPPKQQALLEQGPQDLRYRHASLRYLSSRNDAPELQLKLNGASLRLHRDQ